MNNKIKRTRLWAASKMRRGQAGQALIEMIISISVVLVALCGMSGFALFWLEIYWAESIAYRCALCRLDSDTGADCQKSFGALRNRRLVFRTVGSLSSQGSKKEASCTVYLDNSRVPEVFRKWFPKIVFDHRVALSEFKRWRPITTRYGVNYFDEKKEHRRQHSSSSWD